MTRKKRIDLQICLPNGEKYKASVLPNITVAMLVQEVLIEFGPEIRTFDQHDRQRYGLWLPDEERVLPPDRTIQQVGPTAELLFHEKPIAIPAGTEALAEPMYLRYRSHVFKVAWQPAVIGRPEPNSPHNALLAVNLELYSLAVSRRQAEVVTVDGRAAIRRLSVNPTLLNGKLLPFIEEAPELSPAVLLHADDQLFLERSGIILQCILR